MYFVFLGEVVEETQVRKLPIQEAIQYLNELNQELVEKNEINRYEYELRYKENVVYHSTLNLPQHNFNLYSCIKRELLKDPSNEARQFLKWIQPFLLQEQPVEKQEKEGQPKQSEKGKKNHVLYMLFAGIFIIFAAFLFFFQNQFSLSKNNQDSFESLVKQEKFIQAGEKYPKQLEEIETHLFTLVQKNDQKYLKELEKFQEKYPTVLGEFDLALFHYNYDKAVKLYENNKKKFQSDDYARRVLIGYSYLKLHNIKEAEAIEKEINSPELEKYIYTYTQLSLVIQEKEKKIKQLQEDPVKNQKEIEQLINELFEHKENLENI